MSANGDKRSVSTDALETLGTIIGEGQCRDAIHLAVEPVIADTKLYPGQDIGLSGPGLATHNTDNLLGIVDPFLKGPVMPGERFWLVVYPRQITSLRHVWSHPFFPDPAIPLAVVPAESEKNVSEAWLRDFCSTHDCPGYETVMQIITEGPQQLSDSRYYGASYNDGEYIFLSGVDGHDSIPNEF